jgi:hypothetical protein
MPEIAIALVGFARGYCVQLSIDLWPPDETVALCHATCNAITRGRDLARTSGIKTVSCESNRVSDVTTRILKIGDWASIHRDRAEATSWIGFGFFLSSWYLQPSYYGCGGCRIFAYREGQFRGNGYLR